MQLQIKERKWIFLTIMDLCIKVHSLFILVEAQKKFF